MMLILTARGGHPPSAQETAGFRIGSESIGCMIARRNSSTKTEVAAMDR